VAGSARSKAQQRVSSSSAEGRSAPDCPLPAGVAADGSGIPETVPAALVPGGLRALGATIAWLSGSLAGIGAIFYACGYLATLANLDMLGLDLLAFRYDPTFYIQRGAGFLLLSLMDVGQLWLSLFVVLALAYLGGQLARKRGAILWTKQPFLTFARHRDAWKALGYLVLLLLLAGQLRAHFLFPEDLAVSGVLYPEAGNGVVGSPIRDWILSGKEGLLRDRFAIFVNQQAVIGVLLLIAWGLTRAWRWGALLIAPFAVVFAVSLAWLPLEYGKLALPNKFPQALICFEHSAGTTEQPAATMSLLNKTDSEFVLWDAGRRKIIWVPARTVASAEISASRTLSQIIKSSGETRR
jgi:hypothetical protein